MIKLSNGHGFEYMVASGALGFGNGWFWDKPLIAAGLIKPELFTVVIKTLTRESRQGNLHWWNPLTWLPLSPWSCVRFIPGGSVNKVGLTNKGIEWWCEKVAPTLDFDKISFVGSIFGDRKELLESATRLNQFKLVALEVNDSCPNTGHAMSQAETIISNTTEIAEVSRHPIISKVSVAQDYLAIARGLEGVAEAISLNSVPYEMVYPNGPRSPLWRLMQKLKRLTGNDGGGGGVSGKPAQQFNWKAVRELAAQKSLPVIGPSVMEYADLARVRKLGARAVSFGAIHLRTPCKPTTIVEKETKVADQAVLDWLKGTS
jgi:dihydroorotate dehydrogenase (NAD+) catalytic subunit